MTMELTLRSLARISVVILAVRLTSSRSIQTPRQTNPIPPSFLTPPPRPASLPQFNPIDFLSSLVPSNSARPFQLEGGNTEPNLAPVLLSTNASDYIEVFSAKAKGERDAAVQGDGYMTFKIVPNNTYNLDACLKFCDSVKGCAFANLYHEYNNRLLDYVSTERSNLKCAVFSSPNDSTKKTNFGDQRSIPPPVDLTRIEQSSGWAKRDYWTPPPTPPDVEGYELITGPQDGAAVADGWIKSQLLTEYSAHECASACTNESGHPLYGRCQFFSVSLLIDGDKEIGPACNLFYTSQVISDEKSYNPATPTSIGTQASSPTLLFTRGYRRKSYISDGSFEGIECDNPQSTTLAPDFCWTFNTPTWACSNPPGGFDGCSIIHYAPYARTGSASVLLGSFTGSNNLFGTLTSTNVALDSGSSIFPTVNNKDALATRHQNIRIRDLLPSRRYTIGFFHYGGFGGPVFEEDILVDVLWNYQVVGVYTPGFNESWIYLEADVVAKGDGTDSLMFIGGRAPAWSFVDDIVLMLND